MEGKPKKNGQKHVRFIKKNYDLMSALYRKGTRGRVEKQCERTGITVSEFLRRAVYEKLEELEKEE